MATFSLFGTELVLDQIHHERKRQVVVEGFTRVHDDEHILGELSSAAACYATWFIPTLGDQIKALAWPWDQEWWKPKDVRRDLIRAAALIVAEIERFDRQNAVGLHASPVPPEDRPEEGSDDPSHDPCNQPENIRQ